MTHVGRRQLVRAILGVGGLSALTACGVLPWPTSATRVARVGYVGDTEAYLEAFRGGLRDRGWVEGQNLAIERRAVLGRTDELPAVLHELVSLQVDVIVSGATQAIQAAKEMTQTIPIVMTNVGDPVGTGLVASLAEPGGHVTGTTTFSNQLSAKRVEMLAQIVPRLRRLTILNNVRNPSGTLGATASREAAESLGMTVQLLDLRVDEDLEAAFAQAVTFGADALLSPGQLFTVDLARLPRLAATHHLPVMYSARDWVEAGGLVSYGPSIVAIYRRAAAYVDKILRGARPADLPIEQPTTFELVVNLTTAEALGISLAPHIAAQVTEWVQ